MILNKTRGYILNPKQNYTLSSKVNLKCNTTYVYIKSETIKRS